MAARSGKDADFERWVVLQQGERGIDGVGESLVDGVADVGPVEGDDQDAARRSVSTGGCVVSVAADLVADLKELKDFFAAAAAAGDAVIKFESA
ncbi:hypothetical protein [Streptomyces olivochromogenes]|uniref:hypothetical protein n=1 Tax=Streptomyces olivochromogenes TaxID=1963 RepID=UPI001F43F1A4|nr:hypothetical protein [Streptomyces olivochromogenes]